MGYYNQPAAKLPPAKLSATEAAVQQVKCTDTLEIMGKLMYNCAVAPREEKFRRVKLSNKKLAETIGSANGAIEAMLAFGWVYDESNAQELVVPEGTYFTMKEVRIIEAAKEKLVKDLAEQKRNNSRSNLVGMVATTVQA